MIWLHVQEILPLHFPESQMRDFFFETKKNYGKDVVTGFLRLNGATVGAVANRTEIYNEEGEKTEEFDGTISARGARKAAAFVKFCDAFDIPVLTLTNVTGFKATLCNEKMMAASIGEMFVLLQMQLYRR